MKGIVIMAMKNDDRIIDLMKQIEEKKKALAGRKLDSPQKQPVFWNLTE